MAHPRVRVRFAPSPTGPLHIGGVRTALFNYLFARRHGGDFLLRIEDTDTQRFVPGAEEYINQALAWCGIQVDEGVAQGGPHAPYRQSERKAMYRQHAEALVSSGWAYYAFDTPEELEALRQEAEASGQTFTYNHSIRLRMRTSLSLTDAEVQRLMAQGAQWVIRFRMPESQEVVMNDLIRGQVVVNTGTLDDKVLFKSADQLPTYHLANVTDDHLMRITHVIRGEEWLPSLPLHLLLYQALGWADSMPQFAHLPLLLKPSGHGKLSKRDGDSMGFPVFPLQWVSAQGEVSRGFREEGYIPEAFVNMLALLGWNPGTEQEILSLSELIDRFALERVNKSGARFDPEKAKWFNHQYLLRKPEQEIARELLTLLAAKGISATPAAALRVVGLMRERVNFTHEIWDQANYLFVAPTRYDPAVVKKFWGEDSAALMRSIRGVLAGISPFTAAAAEQAVKEEIARRGFAMGRAMNALRLCLVGEAKGPGVADICEVIGQPETLRRIDLAIDAL